MSIHKCGLYLSGRTLTEQEVHGLSNPNHVCGLYISTMYYDIIHLVWLLTEFRQSKRFVAFPIPITCVDCMLVQCITILYVYCNLFAEFRQSKRFMACPTPITCVDCMLVQCITITNLFVEFRQSKRFMACPTPITCVDWWRVSQHCTVKPVFNRHRKDWRKMSFIDRCPLNTGQYIKIGPNLGLSRLSFIYRLSFKYRCLWRQVLLYFSLIKYDS